MDIEKTIKNLKARHFSVQHFASGEEACKYLLGEIKDTSVGIGGSKTVDQLGLYDKLVANGNEVFWHWREPGLGTLDKENAACAQHCRSAELQAFSRKNPLQDR